MIERLTVQSVLDLQGEPLLILDIDRTVWAANQAARSLLGQDIVGSDFSSVAAGDGSRLSALLERAARSTGPTLAAVEVRTNASVQSRKVTVRRICREQSLVAMEFRAVEDDRFRALNRRIGDLDAEIRERSRIQAGLEEALAQNRLLLRELQHRVKNTVQMLVSLLQGPAAAGGEQTYAELVSVATQRLLAVSRAHELMYRQGDFRSVPAEAFLSALIDLLSSAFGSAVRISLSVEDSWAIPHDDAVAISLIVNELVTNAAKYGGAGHGAVVSVTLARDGGERLLTVRDNGPGMPVSANRNAFGLKLVRGLCRQIGGRLEIYNDGGAVCVIHMRVNDGVQA